MKTNIIVIKSKFEMIKTILGGSLSLEDLSQPKYLKILIDALENTYLSLNDGMCENLNMCKECAQKRDILHNYIQLFDSIELKEQSTHTMEELSSFPKIIDEIIYKIDVILSRF